MRIRLGASIATSITIGFGFLVLLGLLIGDDLGLLSGVFEGTVGLDNLRGLTNILLQLVTVTIGLTVFIGVLNLIIVHLGRLRSRRTAVYSLVVIVSFALVIGTYILEQNTSPGETSINTILLEDVQVSIESALAALLLFALVYGAATVMRRRFSWAGALFVVVVLIVLIGAIPLSQLSIVREISDWLMTIPVNAGARGILLGIALATIVTGIRVLIGQDRSYRE